MISERQQDVENFLENLRSGEYTIESRASKIPYGNSSLAQELSDTLAMYEHSKIFSAVGDAAPYSVTAAISMITAAFSYGVIIQKSDLIKKLRDAENWLQQCEKDNRDWQKNNKDLLEELRKETELKKHFQQRLEKYEPSSSEGDVSHG